MFFNKAQIQRYSINIYIFCIGSVQDIIISQLTSTNCTITWNPPFQYLQYGSFHGYKVMCNISNTNTVIKSDKLIVSAVLKPFTLYFCCITPQWTTNGRGKTKCINFTTLQDCK